MSAPERTVSEGRSKKVFDKLKATRFVISEDGLKRIAEHKYVPGVCTPLDNLMNKHVWTPLVNCLPQWLAPNAVTCTGLLIQILGFAAVSYHCEDFHAAAPRWTYLVAAVTTFLYQTLDALDGKQARRTGSSSPLGQLFDHGCDSVVTIFLGMLTAMSLRLGFSIRCVSFVLLTLLPFWMAQWTEYHTHSLPTSLFGLIGVTEAQFTCMGLMLVNLITPAFWETHLGIGEMPGWWCGRERCPLMFSDGIVLFQIVMGGVGTLHCIYSVASKTDNVPKALFQTSSVWLLAVVGWLWCTMIPHAHPRLVMFTFGTSFSFMTCKMIVAAMSRMEYNALQTVILPLPVILILSQLQLFPRHEDVMLGVYTAIVCYSFFRWVRNAIEEISLYIGIYTFRLGRRGSEKTQ